MSISGPDCEVRATEACAISPAVLTPVLLFNGVVIDLSFSQRSKPDVGSIPLLPDGQVQWCEVPELIVGVAENGLKRWIRCRVAR
jgi:hypothetical protein